MQITDKLDIVLKMKVCDRQTSTFNNTVHSFITVMLLYSFTITSYIPPQPNEKHHNWYGYEEK